MPDNWIYYVVLVVLLLVMIVLGFFIGFYNNADRKKMQDEITNLKTNSVELKRKFELEVKTSTDIGRERDAYKKELEEYVKKLGPDGKKFLEHYHNEVKLGKTRIAIIKKTYKWLTSFRPAPKKDDLGMSDEEFQEYSNSIVSDLPE